LTTFASTRRLFQPDATAINQNMTRLIPNDCMRWREENDRCALLLRWPAPAPRIPIWEVEKSVPVGSRATGAMIQPRARLANSWPFCILAM
jgi:hypothetical protein